VVVLKASLLYGEMLARLVKQLWRVPRSLCTRKALTRSKLFRTRNPTSSSPAPTSRTWTGSNTSNPSSMAGCPSSSVTARHDARTLSLLRELRFNGLFDVYCDGHTNFSSALETVIEGRTYISDSFQPYLKRPRRITLDELTQTEELVLSAIGDGSDDQEAAELLGVSPYTVNTHRKSIMGKRGIHQKGELVRHAVQMGYVHVTPERVIHPGFERRLLKKRRESQPAKTGDSSPA
jgi:DNA-binding CsgD family transcriptional regulator